MDENWALGTLTMVLSGVRILVERSPMCITVPVRSPKRQTSPTRTGRSPITEIPLCPEVTPGEFFRNLARLRVFQQPARDILKKMNLVGTLDVFNLLNRSGSLIEADATSVDQHWRVPFRVQDASKRATWDAIDVVDV
jgi:hypothetical protein